MLIYAFCFPLRKAFMDSSSYKSRGEMPIPPISGRGHEKNSYRWLNKPARTYTYWMGKGKRYLAKREFEQAIWAFRKAKEIRPLSDDARFLLALSYEKRGLEGLPGDQTNWDYLAESEYKGAILLSDHLPSRYNLALLYQRKKDYEKAGMELEHILTVSPTGKMGKMAKKLLTRVFAQSYAPKHLSIKYPEGAR